MKRVFSVVIGILVLSAMVFSQPPVDDPPPAEIVCKLPLIYI